MQTVVKDLNVNEAIMEVNLNKKETFVDVLSLVLGVAI